MITTPMDTPLMTMHEAMLFFRIKDIKSWRKVRRQLKIPYVQIGKNKMFHRDVLEKIALKIQSNKTYA